MDDFHPGRVVLPALQAGFQHCFVAGEHYGQISEILQREERPFHVCERAAVAPETVYKYFHINGLTYARWSFIFCSSKRFHWF